MSIQDAIKSAVDVHVDAVQVILLVCLGVVTLANHVWLWRTHLRRLRRRRGRVRGRKNPPNG